MYTTERQAILTNTTTRFSTFPRTEPPPAFTEELIGAFRTHEEEISTEILEKGLESDGVLKILEPDLRRIGFVVEVGKRKQDMIERPVFFGENGVPTLRYEIDAYHPGWSCGLEVEAGRAWMGNAIYRDLVQSAVMVGVDFLCLAVSNYYKYNSSGRAAVSKDYEKARQLAEALYGHTRFRLPYNLVLIGY